MQRTLSPKQLAEVLGVSESSLKRWADQGKLHVMRTAGGHRRIPVAEAIRFSRAANLSIQRPTMLGLPELAASRAREQPEAEQLGQLLFEHLQQGEEPPVRGTVLELYIDGRSIAWICDGPLRIAMQKVGELYHHERRGIYIEHRATDICLRTLHLLRSLITPADEAGEKADPPREPDQPTGHQPVASTERGGHAARVRALGGAVQGDPYQMPSLMCACALQELGFETINLGPDLPLEALTDAVVDYAPRLVWLACSVTEATPSRKAIGAFADELSERRAALALGGRGFEQLGHIDHPNVQPCGTMRELAAFARGLAV